MAPLPWPPGSGCWDQAEVALTWRSLRAPYPLGSGCWDQAEVPLNWRSLQAPWPLILWVRPTSSIKVLCYGGKIQCIMQLLIPFVAYWTPMESALYNITFGCLNITPHFLYRCSPWTWVQTDQSGSRTSSGRFILRSAGWGGCFKDQGHEWKRFHIFRCITIDRLCSLDS